LSYTPANNIVDPYLSRNVTPSSLNELQETRSLLQKAGNRSDTPEGVAAIRAKKTIDKFMDNLTPQDIAVGANDLPAAMENLRAGRKNAAVAHQLGMIETAEDFFGGRAQGH
jgi:hypothetical protein